MAKLTALRRHKTVWLNQETARPSLPAARARLAEAGPSYGPQNLQPSNPSAPATKAKKTKSMSNIPIVPGPGFR